MRTSDRKSRSWIMLASALVIVAADLFIWAVVGIACSVSDSGYTRVCDPHRPPLQFFVPLIGAAGVLISLAIANRYNRRWIFLLGALAGIASAFYFLSVTSG